MVYSTKMGLFVPSNTIKPKSPGIANIDWKQLTKTCRKSISSFEQFGNRFETPNGPYFYKDNGADILAVAHLDSKLGATHSVPLKLSDDTLFFCPTLDNRAGVYAILNYLAGMGIKYDVLLTTNEENVMSTAIYFNPPKGKKYKWMFSFDSPGKTVSLYNYKCQKAVQILKDAGWQQVEAGRYSDIVDLEHLRCKGFNFGSGVYAEHTTRCYLSKSHYLENMRNFLSFYKTWHGEFLPHTPAFNFYQADEGFGLMHRPGINSYQDVFTDIEIEILEILENSEYDFGNTIITPENIDGIITDYQQIIKGKKYIQGIDKMQKDQLQINFDEVKNAYASQATSIVPAQLDVSETSTSQTAVKIIPISLLRLDEQQIKIVGSEDNPNYSLNQQSRKIEDAVVDKDEPPFDPDPPRTKALESSYGLMQATVFHAARPIIEEMVETPELGDISVGIDNCSQCHEEYMFFSNNKVSLCPKCIAEKDRGIEFIPMSDIEEVIENGASVLIPIVLLNKEESNATETYKQVDGKWQWVGEYPTRIAA